MKARDPLLELRARGCRLLLAVAVAFVPRLASRGPMNANSGYGACAAWNVSGRGCPAKPLGKLRLITALLHEGRAGNPKRMSETC